jgi:hypothetical protein
MIEEFDEFERPKEFEGVERHEFEVPDPEKLDPFQNIHLEETEKINE